MSHRLRGVLNIRHRISAQIYFGLGGAVVLTIAASLVGWLSFNRVADLQSRVNDRSVPELSAAFGVAQFSGVLVDAAPRLAGAATLLDVAAVSTDIDAAHAAFESELAALEGDRAGGERFALVHAHSDTLVSNIDAIRSSQEELFVIAGQRESLLEELDEVRTRLEGLLIPAIDDQLFYTITGYREFDEPAADPSAHFAESEFNRFRALAELQADASLSTQLLASAFGLSDASFIEPLRERFEASTSRIERNLTALEGSELHGGLAENFDRLLALGIGEGNGFDVIAAGLVLESAQRNLLDENRDIAVDLVSEIDGIVDAASASAGDATLASLEAIQTGRTLLLAISVVSLAGALAIAWLYVWRVLLTRLEELAGWMRRMAGGDLETQVIVRGQDEVAEMAAALEVFRRHALEVQRLNLVEKLAGELQGKNDELESVLDELRRAQDQIVVREKLAALGQLTAGVAHEIRNPLNFVKNFSESSSELLTELSETVDEVRDDLPEEQRDLIGEIAGDLSENLERIRSHGERADRIVQDMLMMGRDSGEWQSFDINRLLDEHARLAYHSARASDPDFQLDLQQELDPDIGEITVIPQDLGRVFLNMVGNACDATDEKRRSLAEAADGGSSYSPTVLLSTRRLDDGVEVRIRDNGPGVPEEIADQIFNPFFTTKPTDRGTGLGLAISSDIVRKHGGTIRLESEAGEFTEMIVTLPLAPPEEVQGEMSATSGAATA